MKIILKEWHWKKTLDRLARDTYSAFILKDTLTSALYDK